MVKKMLSLSVGLVDIEVTGATLTRFLNACTAAGIHLHRLKRRDWNTLTASVSVADFKRMPYAMGRTGCRVRIRRRRGAPFAVQKLKKRYVLLGGFAAFLVLWVLILTRVWGITYHMDSALPRAAIQASLHDYGVKIGVPRASIDASGVRYQLMRDYPELEFFAINVLGNTVEIEATKVTAAPELFDNAAHVSLIALKDGVIARQQVRDGEKQFSVGDAVHQGDILASTLVPPTREEFGDYHFAHARGDVYAYTGANFSILQPNTVQKKRYTGEVKRQFALKFGESRVNLYFGSGIAGGSCDKIVEEKKWWLSDSVVFPVSIVVQEYTYFDKQETLITEPQASDTMTARAIQRVQAGGDQVEILSHEAVLTDLDGARKMDFSFEVLEQIAAEVQDDTPMPDTPAPQNTQTSAPDTGQDV